ncbi:beta-ketoacyl synthase chain length factor [Dyella amyloliquefaciens]|uniref:beta-ketoacyl synthase chain length factor n=1 Tax=Dyella amyloliquefaciens TaxID=1770545 RepID=UPI00102E963F|nr:beta-ketoacyl synthase chain length factor [Dyella amyloliquefaciens]
MIDLRIADWRAWAPGLESAEAWQAWANAPWAPAEQGEQPDCSFLPAMQRRRLSRMARIALHVAWPLCGDDEQLPLVFASRHGETTRTYAILGDVADRQPLSPTQFGLSVHNAIAGQWSILRGQRGESTAIAGEADTFEHAMLEAATLIDQGAPAVIVVMTEERPPEAYADWIDDVPFTYAVALRVGASRPDAGAASHWQLQLSGRTTQADHTDWPFALDFVRALHRPAASLMHTWKTRQWIWQRNP